MKPLLAIIFLLSIASSVSAQFRRKPKAEPWPKTETELINKLATCLRNHDTATYYELFPPFDTLWQMVIHNTDQSPEAQQALRHLKEHPQVLIEFDPLYNKNIIGGFASTLHKGEDSGIFWSNTVIARYQLHQMDMRRKLEGFDKIAPERFEGYLFVSDAYNRRMFCVAVTELQKIKGKFFGGQFINVLEANTVEEYQKKERAEKEYFAWRATHPDTTIVDSVTINNDSVRSDTSGGLLSINRVIDDEEDDDVRKEVVDRKYYEGLMDNEIPVKLYLRYLRVPGGKKQLYDGLYKLGDNRRYVRVDISKDKKGIWIIEDEKSVGVMELMLEGNKYKGSWVNADGNGFDVELAEAGTPPGKIEALDGILDRGMSGKLDETKFDEAVKKIKSKEAKAKGEKSESDNNEPKTEKDNNKTSDKPIKQKRIRSSDNWD